MKYSEFFKCNSAFKLASYLYDQARQLDMQAIGYLQLSVSQPIGITPEQILLAKSNGNQLKAEAANTLKKAITEEIKVIEELLPSITDSELKSSMESTLQDLKRN